MRTHNAGNTHARLLYTKRYNISCTQRILHILLLRSLCDGRCNRRRRAFVRWHRGAIERIRERARRGNVAVPSFRHRPPDDRQRLRSVDVLPTTDANGRRSLKSSPGPTDDDVRALAFPPPPLSPPFVRGHPLFCRAGSPPHLCVFYNRNITRSPSVVEPLPADRPSHHRRRRGAPVSPPALPPSSMPPTL